MTGPVDDPARWKLTLLPSPKRLSRARVFGLCGGHPVGEAESRGPSMPHWWPGGQPTALTHPTQKRLSVRMASGDAIPGFWNRSSGGFGGAVGWRLVDGALELIDLHPAQGWDHTIAMGAGGGAFAGCGERKAKKGERTGDTALFWKPDGTMVELPPAEAGGESSASATDGSWVVGTVGQTGGQRAALWPADGSRVIVLGDERSLSEASWVADEEQVGVRWTHKGSAPALWRGSAVSFVDLTPRGHESGYASGCARGHQVGHVQVQANTASGSGSMATKAALWRGDAASFVDLHACVPAPWNASSAAAVEVRDGLLRIVGTVTQFSTTDELTPRETQYLVANRAALWDTRLD
ncbi:MAG: hypothetical protein NDJ94_19475 [Vicinamibacteria bacterium]|nr:hypothetical protein [Vicinamibacteria bacterium]